MLYFIYAMHLSIRLSWRSQLISIHLYTRIFIPVYRGAQSFHKSCRHLKILHARRVTWSKFLNESPQILGVTEQNFASMVTWRPGFARPCMYYIYVVYVYVLFPHKNSSHTLFSYCHKIESWRKCSHGRHLVILCSADLKSPIRWR